MVISLGTIATKTWPWMTTAVIVVAGLMYWLYAESSSIESSLAPPDTATEGLPMVADSAFASNPRRFGNRRLLIRPVQVQEPLGRAVFTLQLPVDSLDGYPVVMDRALLEQDLQVVPDDNVAIAGWVFALNDSIRNVWAERGLYDPENRERLEPFSTFFLTDSLDFVFPGQESQGGAQGGQQGQQQGGGGN